MLHYTPSWSTQSWMTSESIITWQGIITGKVLRLYDMLSTKEKLTLLFNITLVLGIAGTSSSTYRDCLATFPGNRLRTWTRLGCSRSKTFKADLRQFCPWSVWKTAWPSINTKNISFLCNSDSTLFCWTNLMLVISRYFASAARL